MRNIKFVFDKDIILNVCIMIEFILCFFISFFTMLGESSYVSFMFTLTFIVLILTFFYVLFKEKLEIIDAQNLLILLTIIVFGIISILIVSKVISFNYLKKYFMFLSTLIFLYIITKTYIKMYTLNFILLINFLLIFLYYFFYHFGNTAYVKGGLALNFSNPNLLSLWLLHSLLYSIISFFYTSTKIIKLFSIIGILILIPLILQTKTRSVFLALVIFIILFFYSLFQKNKFNKILTIILLLYPLIFSILYLYSINIPHILELFDFVSTPGKGLDSRLSTWLFAFNVIKNSKLFGNYFLISFGTGRSQLHNTHIDTMASYGCFVFLLFIIYLYRIIYPITASCKGITQKIALSSFFAIIIMGSGEAAFVSGSVGMYLLSCSYLLFARNTNKLK